MKEKMSTGEKGGWEDREVNNSGTDEILIKIFTKLVSGVTLPDLPFLVSYEEGVTDVVTRTKVCHL